MGGRRWGAGRRLPPGESPARREEAAQRVGPVLPRAAARLLTGLAPWRHWPARHPVPGKAGSGWPPRGRTPGLAGLAELGPAETDYPEVGRWVPPAASGLAGAGLPLAGLEQPLPRSGLVLASASNIRSNRRRTVPPPQARRRRSSPPAISEARAGGRGARRKLREWLPPPCPGGRGKSSGEARKAVAVGRRRWALARRRKVAQ
jgi:hypothetical protein